MSPWATNASYGSTPSCAEIWRPSYRRRTNIQDGHNVTVITCTIHNHALVGMVATLLDGCEVGEGAIVAAGALIQQGTRIPPRKIRGGVPSCYIKSHAYSFNPSYPPCS